MTNPDPSAVVAAGYDAAWRRYEEWTTNDDDARRLHIERGLTLCPRAETALDLGCGTGLKGTLLLAARLHVTGVDISMRSIEVARRRVPGARFVVADMSDVAFAPASFDLVTAFYSVIHVPRRRQPLVFRNVRGWFRPGGVLVATMAAGRGGEGYEDDWLGVRMYWSNWSEATNLRMVRAAGLEVVAAERRTTVEHGRPVDFLWVTARASPDR